ncbi:MAG: hypothetical protein U1F37_07860 [Alphaproteobacteria bacterium]
MSKYHLLAATLIAAAFAGTAGAEPLSGAAIAARAGEFRGDTLSDRGFESHIWRLLPGGEARAVVTLRRGFSAFTATAVEFGDSGAWRVEGNTLCVQWSGPNARFSGCYAVDAQQGNHVRLVGPARWEGTLDR